MKKKIKVEIEIFDTRERQCSFTCNWFWTEQGIRSGCYLFNCELKEFNRCQECLDATDESI